MERAARLEDLELWEGGFDVPVDGVEPKALFTGLLFSGLGQTGFEVARALKSFLESRGAKCELVAYSFLPDLSA